MTETGLGQLGALYPWLGLSNAASGGVLGAGQYDESALLQHSIAMASWHNALGGLQRMNWHALMPIDRQMQADLAFKAQRFSQNWLNAMLDVELGLC